MDFREYVKTNRVIMDGAMGTYYSRLMRDEQAISEYANIEHPEQIEKIHKDYIEAGATLIRTNTFTANTVALSVDAARQDEIIEKACQIARHAVTLSGKQVYIAGAIGPVPERAESDEQHILAEYERMADRLLSEKVDVILFETFSDYEYINKVVKYIREKSDVFIMTNFCLNRNGYTAKGISAKRILTMAESMDEIDAVGFNCGIGSGHMLEMVEKLTFPTNKYIAVLPNAGYPEQFQNRMVFFDNANYFCDNMLAIEKKGFHIIGGCCGTTPEYIEKLALKSKNEVTRKVEKKVNLTIQEISDRQPVSNQLYNHLFSGKKIVAVELDPPYDAKDTVIIEKAQAVKKAGADIITIADSPMGRSRVDSILMSIKIARTVGINVMPHVCCRDKNMIAMRSTLLGAYINDIRNILVVTGDPVPSENRINTSPVFDYNSIQLMNFIKEMNIEHFASDPICYGGALNPGRGKIDKIVERMQKKIDAGATYFLTQPVYSDEGIERLREIRSRLDTKILWGIMPFVSFRNANFIKNEMAGIDVPDEIVARYRPDMSKEEAEQVGADVASEIIEKVHEYADGYYFMLPFNRVSLLDKIKIK